MYKEIEDLLLRARQGEDSATEELIERLKPLIIHSIKRYYNKMDEFQDLIQDGNIAVLECINDFDKSKNVYFLGYVKTMLRYLYLNKHNIKYHESLNKPIGDEGDMELMDTLISEEKSPMEAYMDLERDLELDRVLSILTERQRQVILYFYMENLSLGDIGKKLGISYRTVVNTRTRALEILRENIID